LFPVTFKPNWATVSALADCCMDANNDIGSFH
jgi:hypothetical protein